LVLVGPLLCAVAVVCEGEGYRRAFYPSLQEIIHQRNKYHTSMYRHCLSRQVNEIELLKSFFCNEGELEIVKEHQYEQIKVILETPKGSLDTAELPSFSVNIALSFFYRKECSITMSITFPPFYPSTESLTVDFYGASKIFTREQEQQVRQEISNFALNKVGQECVLDVVQFAKDWLETTFMSPIASTPSSPVSDLSPCSSEAELSDDHHGENGIKQENQRLHEVRRVLLWFATIAPDRAKAVADWAKQLGLTGLSKLGTPALLVAEGAKVDVDEFISSLRSFRWKKMDLVWEECCRVPDVNSFRKFHHFDECMVSISDLQPIFRNAGLEEVFKEGLKMHGFTSFNVKVL